MGLFKADHIVINPTPQTTTPAASSTPAQPQVVVLQQQPDQGIWTLNGKRYMSALLVTSYLSAKLITATGQAHLLSGATDAQLIDDYRNGDVSSSVLTLFAIPTPKGMTQLKQSPVMLSPEFPATQAKPDPLPVMLSSGSWTFTVPQGWGYSVDATAPTLTTGQSLGPVRPQNILFAVDAIRSTRTPRSDGGWDVTVYGEWTEMLPVNQDVDPVLAGTYSALIVATLYPTDNPPPNS